MVEKDSETYINKIKQSFMYRLGLGNETSNPSIMSFVLESGWISCDGWPSPTGCENEGQRTHVLRG